MADRKKNLGLRPGPSTIRRAFWFLHPGEKHLFDGRLDEPEIHVVGGARPYLWVGGRGCVGTLEGRALRSLAREILRLIPVPRAKARRKPEASARSAKSSRISKRRIHAR